MKLTLSCPSCAIIGWAIRSWFENRTTRLYHLSYHSSIGPTEGYLFPTVVVTEARYHHGNEQGKCRKPGKAWHARRWSTGGWADAWSFSWGKFGIPRFSWRGRSWCRWRLHRPGLPVTGAVVTLVVGTKSGDLAELSFVGVVVDRPVGVDVQFLEYWFPALLDLPSHHRDWGMSVGAFTDSIMSIVVVKPGTNMVKGRGFGVRRAFW